MSCCDDQGHDCLQSDACPHYKHKRRVRAGQPAPDVTLWIKDIDKVEKQMEDEWRSDLKAILFVASCILAFFLIVLVTA
jgi:hypothetical protein